MFRVCILSLCILAPITQPAAAAVLQVGPGQTYATLAAAIGAASANDTIQVHGGGAGYAYTDQVATVSKALSIIGIDDGYGLPVFTLTPGNTLANRKGFLVVQADTLVSGLIFKNAFVSDSDGGNGAGIRHEAGNLTVVNSRFIGDQDGILSTPIVDNTNQLTVRNSIFTDDGSGSGFTHAIYANRLSLVTVTGSSFTGTNAGHDIKSRAAQTIVTGNYLDDGVTGSASYAIDLPNGGNATISGNTLVQGANTGNRTMVAYGAEGLIWGSNTAGFDGNSFINLSPGTTTGIRNFQTSGANLSITGNSFCGLTNDWLGPATASGNTSSAGPCSIPVPAPALGLSWGLGLLLLAAAGRSRPTRG